MANNTQIHPVVVGARAVVYIDQSPVGIFTRVVWNERKEQLPIHILGRFSPAEIVVLSQEAISISATGFRVLGGSPYKILGATQLKDLLNQKTFTLKVVDRQSKPSDPPLFIAHGCVVVNWSSGVTARAPSDITVDILGRYAQDEASVDNAEDPSGVNLTDGL